MIPDRDRRQTPRVDLMAEFHGHLVTLDEPVRILQLGAAGMTLAAPVPLSPTQDHDLQLTVDGEAVRVKARVVHWRTAIDRNEFIYVCGMSFVNPPVEVVALIERFVERTERGAAPPGGADAEPTPDANRRER